MKTIRSVLAVSLLILVSACASGPKFSDVGATIPSIPDGSARVYFYRTQVFGAAIQPTIKLNGNPVGDCEPDGVFYTDLKPGDYKANVETEVEHELTFTLSAKDEKFVRCYISMGLFVGRGNLELVDPTEGRKDIQTLSYTGKPKVKQ